MRKLTLAILLLTLLATACQTTTPTPPASPTPAQATPAVTVTPPPPTITPTSLPSPTSAPTMTLTPQRIQAQSLEITASQAQARVFQPVELEILTDGMYANPYDPREVDLQARLTPPTGEPFMVPAFWYQDFDPQTQTPRGEPGWRVRFTPDRPGQWIAQAVLEGPALQSDRLSIEVLDDPTAQGFVRVHPTNNHYFAFDNGETFYPVGINIGWGGEHPLADYERWLDGLAANGGSIIRVWMASWSFGIEWNDTGLGNYTPRLERAWQLDQVMRMAEERGIKVVLVLLNHGAFSETVNPQWYENPFNLANGGILAKPEEFATHLEARRLFQQRLRYIAARWAASPSLMAWEWWNEEDWTPITPQVLIPWIQEMTPVLRQYDPYHHLITTSFAQSSVPEVANLPEIDFAQLHLYDATDPAFAFPDLYETWRAQIPDKPILFGEFGNSAGLEDARSTDQQGLHLHNSLWASTFAGYASTAMYWWWDLYVDPLALWPVYGSLNRFLSGEDLALYHPAKAILSSRSLPYRVLAAADRQLIWLHDRKYDAAALQNVVSQNILAGQTPEPGWSYLPEPISGVSITLMGLPDGEYIAYWYSPNSGEWLKRQVLTCEDEQCVMEIPTFQGDLAAKVRPVDAPPPN